jgi:RHS repeat-associated protein
LIRFRKACRDRFHSHALGSQPSRRNRRTCFEGPFGEVIRATGPMAKANPFRFSTKYQDDETDLLYYGYRYYSASTGRWLSRDPLQEEVALNLYAFVDDNAISYVDVDGNKPLHVFPWGPPTYHPHRPRRPTPPASIPSPGGLVVVTIPHLHPEGDTDNGAERQMWYYVLKSALAEGYEVLPVSSVSDANAKLKKCKKCIKELNIEGHGRGAGVWIGSDRGDDNYFAVIPRLGGGYEFKNVDAMFGGQLTFCTPCTINLRGCSIASQDGWPELKDRIGKLTKCTVKAFLTDSFPGTDDGLSAPIAR